MSDIIATPDDLRKAAGYLDRWANGTIDGKLTQECRALSGRLRELASVSDPTEARRRLTESAREWSGPDRWQIAATTDHDDGAPPTKAPPGGYEPIGAWQPYAANSSWTDWRRPLRRVSE